MDKRRIERVRLVWSIAASSPLVAWFYGESRLAAITLILSSTFFLSGLTIQHIALLKRQMRFKAVAFIQVTSMLVGVVVGVSMAWLGYSYWALVISNVVAVAVTIPLTWCAIPWWPQLPSRRSGTRSLVRFGTSMAGGGFIYSLAKGADNLLIGRFYGADSIGLYSRAAALLNRPLEQFLFPISSVFVPALSRLQTQPERYRRTFLQVYESMALLSCLLYCVIVCAFSSFNSRGSSGQSGRRQPSFLPHLLWPRYPLQLQGLLPGCLLVRAAGAKIGYL